MNKLKNIMAGRYGWDQLSIVLLLAAAILTVIGRLSSLYVFTILSYVPLLISLFRAFSKDIKKRSMENYKFAILMSPIYSKFMKIKNRVQGSKKYKYFKCPECKKTLRVPRGKNKIMVTCPQCETKFSKKT